MIVSMAGFAVSDAIMKLVVDHLPLFQAIFLRGSLAGLLLVILAWHQDVLDYRPQYADWPMICLRALSEVAGMICLLNALVSIPFVNATAIIQTTPLLVTLGAVFLLGERAGWRRYLAIMIGFLGVLVIIRPVGDGFTIHSLWAIGSVIFFTIRDLSTRRLSSNVPSIFAAMITAIAIVLVGGLGAALSPWQPVGDAELKLLGLAAFCTVLGYIFSIMTMRVGDVGFVAPFRYSILLWALLLGMLLFSELPDAATLVGSMIIVGAGLYTIAGTSRGDRKPVAEGRAGFLKSLQS